MKYTIAIPVYNDASSLDKCLHSVLNQTIGLEHIEIICVNDGSTDESVRLLDEYQEKYSCVKVIHQENSGSPSGPRNRAVEAATGEYIFFLDADDYLGLEALEKMDEKVKEYNSDIVIGRYEGINRSVPTAVFKRNPDSFEFIGSNALTTASAQKLFRVSLLRNHSISFPEHLSLGEDQTFLVQAYAHSNSISLVKDYTCYYLTNDQATGRVQLTKRPMSGEIFVSPLKECFQAIKDLQVSEDKKRRIYHQYWKRIFQVELPSAIRRPLLLEDKKHIMQVLGELLREHQFETYYMLFSNQEKLYVRLLEYGNMNDLISYWYEEKNDGNMVVYYDKVFPSQPKAREIAQVEGLSFHKLNTFSATSVDIEIKSDAMLLKGMCTHSHIQSDDQHLFLELVSRNKEESLFIPAEVCKTVSAYDFCLDSEVRNEKNPTFFVCRIADGFFLRDLKDEIYDLKLISKIGQFSSTARIVSDESSSLSFEVTKQNQVRKMESYTTTNGNLSIKLKKKQSNENSPVETSALQKTKKKIKRLIN